MGAAPPFLTADGPDLPRWFDVPALEAWDKAATRLLKGRPLSSLTRPLPEGILRAPLYTSEDPCLDVGHADAPPYLRGSRVLDRRQAGWDARTLVDAGSVGEAAQAIGADLSVGCRSVWLVPDRAARGLPGNGGGVPVRDLADLVALLDAVDLTQHPVHLDAGLRAQSRLEDLTRVADHDGVSHDLVTGAVVSDPMAVWGAEGSLPGTVDEAYDGLAGAVRFAARLPWVQVAQVSTLPWAEAGAHAVQELSYLLASGAELLRRMDDRGVDVATLAPRVLLQTTLGRDTFVEIAKQRAARLLWSKLLAACGGSAEAQRPFMHAVTSRSLLSTRDPWVNLLRTAHGAFIGGVSGVDAMTIVPWDRALGVPDAVARRAAATMHAVLEAEAHLARVADPAGGSWYVERLTHGLAHEAWAAFQDLERAGGMAAALASGRIEQDLAITREARLKDLHTRKDAVVGVSVFPNATEERPVRHAVDEPVAAFRDAACWEALRDAADAAPVRPAVHLATLGPLARHTARADFAAQLFEAGGFAVHRGDEAGTVAQAMQAYVMSGAPGAVICGSDDDYATYLPALATSLRQAGAQFVVLAGRPQDAWAEGLTHAVYVGADVWTVLTELQTTLGVSR